MRGAFPGWLGAIVLAGLALPAWGQETPASAPADGELKDLRAENRLLKANLKAMRAQLEALQTENARLRQHVTMPTGPAATQPASASRPARTGPMFDLAELLTDYGKRKAAIRWGQETQAQKQISFKKAREDFVLAFGRPHVTVQFEVTDVRVTGEFSACISTGVGTIRDNGAPEPALGLTALQLTVRMGQAAAMQIKRGTPLTLTGTLVLLTSDNAIYLYCPDGTAPLGFLYPAKSDASAPFASRMEVAVRDDRTFALNGVRLEVTRFTGAVSAAPASKAPKRPPGK